MKDIKELRIIIVDKNKEYVDEFKKAFSKYAGVEVVYDELENFYNHRADEIDCLVSPANAFGRMTGGFDAALSNILGWDFQKKVQNYIKKNFYGEQPVSSSFIIKTNIPNLSLIHTPTMRYPSVINDIEVVYHCMRNTLICALKNNINCIVIPAFGGSCGGVHAFECANLMLKAYEQIFYKASNLFDF